MKKGFTLIELLAVIVILAVIMVIAVPRVLKVINDVRESAYVSNTKLIEKSASNYLSLNVSRMPIEIGDVSIITLAELQSNNFIGIIKDSKDSTKQCTGYVVIKKINSSDYQYTPAMKCDTNYQTVDYVQQALSSVEVLVVAGGGSGGTNNTCGTGTGAGGGGAGGLLYNSNFSVIQGEQINVLVGNGGQTSSGCSAGNQGGNSSFGTITATGGGGGGYRNGYPTNGGSGGGVGYYSTAGGIGIAGQGSNGGSSDSNIYGGAGGGGAGGIGIYSTSNAGTNGGPGLYYGDIFGNVLGHNGWFSGGGGGGAVTSSAIGNGGIGGGGNGGSGSNGIDAISNTGSGGGGSGISGYLGGAGGSGIVIVRYSGIQRANGGIVTTVSGYTIHTFTSGTATFTVLPF